MSAPATATASAAAPAPAPARIDPAAFAAWQDQSRRLDSMQIAFIIGPPKCGTTWVQWSLGGHPDIAAGGESALGRALFPGVVDAFRNYNTHQSTYGSESTPRFSDRDFLFLLRQAADRILLHYLDRTAPADGGPLRAVIDKTPSHAQHMDLLARLYPRAKFICCTRDPRDGAVSGWFHFRRYGWVRQKSLEEYALVYAEQTWGAMMRAARTAGRTLGPQQYIELDYADHIADPHAQIRRLLTFLDLPADDRCVTACVDAGDFTRRAGGRTRGTEQRDAFLRKGVVGDWTNHLTADQGQRILDLAHAAAAGRAAVGPSPTPATAR